MYNAVVNFHQILFEAFCFLHENFFGSQFVQNLTFERSEIKIFRRSYKKREIYFFLFFGLLEDFKKATSGVWNVLSDSIFYFHSGISRENEDIWIEPVHTVPATFPDGRRVDHLCMYFYFLSTVNAKNEFLEFVRSDFLTVDNFSPGALAEICAIMICAHEMRHEVQFSESTNIREDFPSQLTFVDMKKFSKFIKGMLDFYARNDENEDWKKREKDACIAQVRIVDAWIKYQFLPLEERLKKIQEIVLC